MMRAPQLDDSRIIAQIDRVAQARAELEKLRARLVLGIRHVLTPDQWNMMQRMGPPPPPHEPGSPAFKPRQ